MRTARLLLLCTLLLAGWLHGFHSDAVAVQVVGQSLVLCGSASLIAAAVAEDSRAPIRLQAQLSRPWLRAAVARAGGGPLC